MPAFDLRYLQVAEYKKKDGGTEYGTATSMGDAMTVVLDLRFAEGRLYAESTLAEYMKKATGGTATAGVKYIPTAAQKLMFRAYEKQRTVSGISGSPVKSLTFGKLFHFIIFDIRDSFKNVVESIFTVKTSDDAEKIHFFNCKIH